MARDNNWVELEDCEILQKRDLSIEVRWDGSRYWLPYSQMPGEDRDGDRFKEGDTLTVMITEWLAEQKGIET